MLSRNNMLAKEFLENRDGVVDAKRTKSTKLYPFSSLLGWLLKRKISRLTAVEKDNIFLPIGKFLGCSRASESMWPVSISVAGLAYRIHDIRHDDIALVTVQQSLST